MISLHDISSVSQACDLWPPGFGLSIQAISRRLVTRVEEDGGNALCNDSISAIGHQNVSLSMPPQAVQGSLSQKTSISLKVTLRDSKREKIYLQSNGLQLRFGIVRYWVKQFYRVRSVLSAVSWAVLPAPGQAQVSYRLSV